MKKRLCLVLPALLGCSVLGLQPTQPTSAQASSTTIAASSSDFSDVSSNNYWAINEINMLKVRHILEGYADGTFKPYKPVSRAEAVIMLARAENVDLQNIQAALTFKDVPATYWASKEIAAAAKLGILQGYNDGTFHPDSPITRAEASIIFQRSYNFQGIQSTKNFDDLKQSDWAYNSIETLVSNGIMDGTTNNKVEPERSITRAEISVLTARVINKGVSQTWSDKLYHLLPLPTPLAVPDSLTDSQVYNLDLAKWGVHNDGTHPAETTNGINKALQWAHDQGYSVFKVPAGNYLIASGDGSNASEKVSQINMVSDMTFLADDHAVFQKESNGLPGYTLLSVGPGVKNVLIKGGTYIGDRDTHNYRMDATTWLPNHTYKKGDKVVPPVQNGYYYIATTDGVSGTAEPAWTWTKLSTDHTVSWQPTSVGTHEGGCGIVTSGAFNVTIDGVKTEKFTGDGLDVGGGSGYFQDLYDNSFESGSIDANGNNISDSTKIRTGSYPLTNPSFNLTHQVIVDNPINLKGGTFDAYFYKADGSFLTKLSNQQRGKYIDLPIGAASIRMVFTDTKRSKQYIEIWNRIQSTGIVIQNSESYLNRRQGLTIGGGKNVLIQNNKFHDIGGTGGTPPMAGIDIEGGAGDNGFINDTVVIKDNDFYKNSRYDLIFYDGHDGYAEGNHFGSTGVIGVAVSEPFTGAFLKDNWFDGTRLLGYHDVKVIGNKMNDNTAGVSGPNASVDGMIFTNASLNAGAAVPYGVSYSNLTFNNKANDSLGLGLWGKNPTLITNVTMYGGSIGGDTVPGYILDNLKMYNNPGFPLVPATYKNCTVEMADNSKGLYTVTTKPGSFIIDNCQMNTGISVSDPSAEVSIMNSTFDLTDPKSAFGFGAKKVLFLNNAVTANHIASVKDYNCYNGCGLFIIGGYWIQHRPATTQQLIVKNNTFTTNLPVDGIKTIFAGAGAPSYSISDNTLYNAQLNLKPNDVNVNNSLLKK